MPPTQSLTRYALAGRIVTMTREEDVINDGVLYIDGDHIVAAQKRSTAPPVGFEAVQPIETGGTLYPGMIELHNHLTYNVLPLWQVPKAFSNRGAWGRTSDYRKYITGPMELLRKAGDYLPAIVRYVECKCLVSGVTTSQGITLSGAGGIEKLFRGMIRNPESPDRATLPKAGHRIGDVSDAEKFFNALDGYKCYLLHLSEGVDETARKFFTRLKRVNASWALTDALVGIHSAGLLAEDFQILKDHGCSMVWSPLSNLLLYSGTARVEAAKANGLRIALGSDWSPSGSKNLLGELKVAWLYSQWKGNLFTPYELVSMATRLPAEILRWDGELGTLQANRLADLFVVKGTGGDPYEHLLQATEADIHLVVINGLPRYGLEGLMHDLGQDGERWRLRNSRRLLHLSDIPDEEVVPISLKEARSQLKKAMKSLPELAKKQAAGQMGAVGAIDTPSVPYTLVLDNEFEDLELFGPVTTAEVIGAAWAASIPLPDLVIKMELDELTVAEDPENYLQQFRNQPNLPPDIAQGLPPLYGL